MEDKYFKFTPSVVLLPFFSVLLLWIVYWVELRFNFNFTQYGILPRTLEGLRGLIFSPLIHGNLEHLFNNSVPLLVLLAALRYFYRELTWKVLGYGILLSGLITWIIGRESYHIGASGLIYVLVSFIFFKGILTKYYRLVALSLTIIVIYGGMIWYVFPGIEQNVSWEGHLGGLISGFAFAIFYQTPQFKRVPKYDWEFPNYNPANDKFMQRFDDEGNFVNPPPPDPDPEEDADIDCQRQNNSNGMQVTYRFIDKLPPNADN
jgi:membrane associated rhomboid family serine protease